VDDLGEDGVWLKRLFSAQVYLHLLMQRLVNMTEAP
jgi:hypothetical protein